MHQKKYKFEMIASCVDGRAERRGELGRGGAAGGWRAGITSALRRTGVELSLALLLSVLTLEMISRVL